MSAARCGTTISNGSMHLKQINHIRKLRKESLQRAGRQRNGHITQENCTTYTESQTNDSAQTFLPLLTVGAHSSAET